MNHGGHLVASALLDNAVEATQAYYCVACGKCTGSCPISKNYRDYAPRLVVERALLGASETLCNDKNIWRCLTCNTCNLRCPSDVKYPEFIRALREMAFSAGARGECTHGGLLQALMQIMAHAPPDLPQQRLKWLARFKNLKIAKSGRGGEYEWLYFVGCLPHFDIIFSELEVDCLEIARATIRILNSQGIRPLLLDNEKCCGHDLLWTGDTEAFRKLAAHNIRAIKESGAEKVLVSCPECYRTLKKDYAEYADGWDDGIEVIHISEFLAERIETNQIEFTPSKTRVRGTFHDPCRLGKHMGMFVQPRTVLKAIPSLEFMEMERSFQRAICCGTSAWINCDNYAKQMQVDRLEEAYNTGSEVLITSCPKCLIHFKCTVQEPAQNLEMSTALNLEIKDLTTIVADAVARRRK
jgi:Fe-S oxidoreductase